MREPLFLALAAVVVATVVFHIGLYSLMTFQRYEQNNKELLFAVYTTSADPPTISVLTKYYTQSRENYYVIDDTAGKELFLYFPHYKKMLIGASVKELSVNKVAQAHIQSFSADDIIAYDIENWPATPLQERVNAADSISNASKIVHQAGYKFGVTPDSRILLRWYETINWDEVDFLGMQLQEFSVNPEELAHYARLVSEHVRSESPETQIFIQLSFRRTDVNDMQNAIKAVENFVDGVIVGYVADGRIPCKYCSPENLDEILYYINIARNT